MYLKIRWGIKSTNSPHKNNWHLLQEQNRVNTYTAPELAEDACLDGDDYGSIVTITLAMFESN